MATQRRAKISSQQNSIILLVVVAVASLTVLALALGLWGKNHHTPTRFNPSPSKVVWTTHSSSSEPPPPPPKPRPSPPVVSEQRPAKVVEREEPRPSEPDVDDTAVDVGGPLPQSYSVCSPDDPIWTPTSEIGMKVVRQEHHYAFGRPWALGRDIFNFQVRRGLEREHVFLDFGCGALRNGIWLIDHLEAGHYYGVEYNTQMFLAGKNYELALHGLQHKKPTLYNNAEDGQPGLRQWGVKFDRIMAFAVLIHLPVPLKHTVLRAFSDHLKVGGKLFLSHHLSPVTEKEMLSKYFLKLTHKESQKSEFSDTHLDWFEFERVESE